MSTRNPRHIYISDERPSERVRQSMRLKEDRFYQEIKEVMPDIAEQVYHKNRGYGEPSTSCKGPAKFGIENSEQIIPNYYLSGKDLKGKIFECDFHYSIIDSIRNMRILSKYQQEYVEKLEKEECYELLREYNKVMKFMTEYIMAENT
jgi:hypothetical protein